MHVTNQIDELKWRRFVDDHPHGNIFHTPEMFQTFTLAKNHHPTLWAVTEGNHQDSNILALLLPVKIKLRDGFLRLFTSRAVVFGSVLCTGGPRGQQALTKLLEVYKESVKGRFLFTELRNLSNLDSIKFNLEAHNFLYEEHLNYLINLSATPEDIMQSIGRRTRKNIRRALRKEQVIIMEANEPERIKNCYSLLAKTYAHAKVPLADYSLFEAAFRVLYPKNMIKFWLARVGDDYVATSVELLYKKIIYGWYGGMDRKYGSFNANELLMWHILNWGNQKGFSTYDFGGAGKPNEPYGVRNFKAKFGGQLVNFGRHIHVHAPLAFSISSKAYQIYRKTI